MPLRRRIMRRRIEKRTEVLSRLRILVLGSFRMRRSRRFGYFFYFFDIFSINISDASDRSEKHVCII